MTLSATGASLLRIPARRSCRSMIVSPGRSLPSSPKRGVTAAGCSVTALPSSPACSALGSTLMCTASATPSGSTVGSTERGNLLLPNNTSTICPYAASVFVLVTLTNTRDFSVSVNCTSGPYKPR